MTQLPPFHPDWLVTFWFSTPILRAINPHWFLIVLTLIAIGFFFVIRRGKAVSPTSVSDTDEQQFQHLLTKKQIIERKIAELENKRLQGELSDEIFQSKLAEYTKHLEKAKLDLLYYT